MSGSPHDGAEFVHCWEPRDEGARTLLLLHGTGGDENDLISLGESLDPGANLLSPRGQVLEQGMPRFFRRLAAGVFDLEDLTARTHGLSEFVLAAAQRYAFDPLGVTVVGFSNGANIAAAMLLLRPGTVRRAVLLRAMVPLTPDVTPDLRGTSVLIAAGRHDTMIPPMQSDALAAQLRAAGAEVSVRWEAAGHQITRADVEAVRDWLRDASPDARTPPATP